MKNEIIQFSEREKDVIELLLKGKSNKQIALALGVSVRAVEFHLSNTYSKLGVTSRTEAALKLQEIALRESTSDILRESTVTSLEKSVDNDGGQFNQRRFPMKSLFTMVGGGLITTALIVTLILVNIPFPKTENLPTMTATPAYNPATATVTLTHQPAISPKEHILERMRQLVTEYEQAVQAEKKNGKVEFSTDSQTGEEIFVFKDDSYIRIDNLFMDLNQQIIQLDELYAQVYRDETLPTPFPTQLSPEENKKFYELLITEQGKEYCAYDVHDKNAILLPVYHPDDGNYMPFIVGDVDARCLVWGQMIEEFRLAPLLEKVDQDADMETIRLVTGKPDLVLKFKTITSPANASGRNAALYVDETGTRYYTDVETARLVQIEPNFPSHPEVPAGQVKSVDQLRGVAEQFALTNSPRLAELRSVLVYEENGKGNFYFFTWSFRNKDWSGTEWAMMPPFLQIGVLSNGQIVTYINTLDLYK